MGLGRCRWGVDALQLGCQLSVWIPEAPTGGSWPRSGEEEAGDPGVQAWGGEQGFSGSNVHVISARGRL